MTIVVLAGPDRVAVSQAARDRVEGHRIAQVLADDLDNPDVLISALTARPEVLLVHGRLETDTQGHVFRSLATAECAVMAGSDGRPWTFHDLPDLVLACPCVPFWLIGVATVVLVP